MKIFSNTSLVPKWIYKQFLNGKLNFSRLWAVFLSYDVKALEKFNNLD
jgi:hypothetical protein